VTAADRAPGPRRYPVVGNLLPFMWDPLGYVTRIAREHGDVALVHMGGLPFYLVSHPDAIEDVLVTHKRSFSKGGLGADKRLLFGRGLATSDGELWRRQRKLIAPVFHRKRIATYAESMRALAEDHARSIRDGEPRELHADLMGLTLRIVAKTLFDADAARDADGVREALETVMRFFTNEPGPVLRLVPRRIPTPRRLRYRRAVAHLDGIIHELIARRRRSGADPGDLLSMLMATRDEDGAPMSDRQVRDEAMTLFVAGHETTALALTWTFALLARHPAVEAKLVDEIRRGPASAPYAHRVLKEAMRLYPPAWIVARQATEAVTVGRYRIPARAFVAVSQWVVHRDPRWFASPDAFIPERWDDALEAALPRHAYVPFGGGPRVCIGNAFAMTEAVTVLTTLLREHRFVLSPDFRLRPQASLSLRPRGGVDGHFERRYGANAASS
jgi:cytochrome P450